MSQTIGSCARLLAEIQGLIIAGGNDLASVVTTERLGGLGRVRFRLGICSSAMGGRSRYARGILR